MSDIAPPGYYPAQGDPPGTVRYWDGVQWSADPMPPPPGYDPSRRPGDERFATVGIRIGAVLLDGLIGILVSLVFLVPYMIDVFEDIDAGGDGTSVSLPTSAYVVGLVLGVASLLCVAFLGGSPGKLMVGLRITLADGTTTPPGVGPAALRFVPALLAMVPFVGVLVSVGFTVASLVMVNTDPERRSAYDRIAGTRVVYKRHL